MSPAHHENWAEWTTEALSDCQDRGGSPFYTNGGNNDASITTDDTNHPQLDTNPAQNVAFSSVAFFFGLVIQVPPNSGVYKTFSHKKKNFKSRFGIGTQGLE